MQLEASFLIFLTLGSIKQSNTEVFKFLWAWCFIAVPFAWLCFVLLCIYHCVFFLFYLHFVVGRPLSLTTKSFMGCPLPFQLPWFPQALVFKVRDYLQRQCLKGPDDEGSRDAIWCLRMRLVWGLRKSRDASQPVNLSSVNLRWSVEWFWTAVYLW